MQYYKITSFMRVWNLVSEIGWSS